jgi:hypothetical protein
MPELLSLETNATSTLIHPGVHDGNLVRVEIMGGNGVELTIKTNQGSIYLFQLSGVLSLYVGELGLINVILDITIEDAESSDVEFLLEHLGFTKYLNPENYRGYIRAQLLKQGNRVLTLSPSQGASLCAVFKTLQCWKM